MFTKFLGTYCLKINFNPDYGVSKFLHGNINRLQDYTESYSSDSNLIFLNNENLVT
jgi:hypothetical protein